MCNEIIDEVFKEAARIVRERERMENTTSN